MAATPPHRRVPRLLGAAAVVLLTAGAWWQAGTPARASDRTVEVVTTPDGAFTPARVEIVAGDAVTWAWQANEPHTITFDGGSHAEGSCVPTLTTDCSDATHRVTFGEAGEFPYRDDFTGSTGVVVVQPAPTSTPTRPSPTPDPTSEPDPSPSSPSPDPSPTSSPPAPEPSSSPPPAPGPTTRTAAPQPVVTASSREQTPTAAEPSVAAADDTPSPIPEPSFEDFPEADEPDPGDDVSGDVALGAREDGGGTERTIWGVVGGVTVLGTLGAVGRTVLFSDAWDT